VHLKNFERLAIADLIASESDVVTLKTQLESAAVTERQHTGSGVFVHLSVPDGAPRVSSEHPSPITGDPRPFLRHPEVESGAMAILWIEGGRMDCLEMCVFGDENWPLEDSGFQLSHEWPKGYF
jgi:hypothetical protein